MNSAPSGEVHYLDSLRHLSIVHYLIKFDLNGFTYSTNRFHIPIHGYPINHHYHHPSPNGINQPKSPYFKNTNNKEIHTHARTRSYSLLQYPDMLSQRHNESTQRL